MVDTARVDGIAGPEPVSDANYAHAHRRRQIRASLRIQVARLAVFVVILVLWNLAVKLKWLNPIYAATPRQTWDRLITLLGQHLFWTDLGVTLREALTGWLLGSVAGLTAGLLLGRWEPALKVFGPFLTFFNAIPKIALAPIIILWFGIGESSKVFTAVLTVFFIVQVPTTAAVGLVDPDLAKVATAMGASEFQRFVRVYLPGVLAAVFGALRLAAVFALLTVVFTEFLAAERGLGQRLITATNQFDMPTAFALMIVLSSLALLVNGGVGLIERRVMRWKRAGGSGNAISL